MCNNIHILTLNNVGYILSCHERLTFFPSFLHFICQSLHLIICINWTTDSEKKTATECEHLLLKVTAKETSWLFSLLPDLHRAKERLAYDSCFCLHPFLAIFLYNTIYFDFGVFFIGHRSESLFLPIIDSRLPNQLSMLFWETQHFIGCDSVEPCMWYVDLEKTENKMHAGTKIPKEPPSYIFITLQPEKLRWFLEPGV